MAVRTDVLPGDARRDFRFSQRFRLKSPAIIRQILSGRSSARRRWDAFRLIWGHGGGTRGQAPPRFAFVVSRDAGSAVTRNRIKRRLREAVRTQRDHWPERPIDVVFRVNSRHAWDMAFPALRELVAEALTAVSNTPL